MSNKTSQRVPEVTEAKLNSLAAEYAAFPEVHLATEGDKDVDWSIRQSRNNLSNWLEQTVQVEIKAPIYLEWHLCSRADD